MSKIKIDKELLKGCVPLLVLRLFRDGDLYGYQIIKNLETLSDKAFIFKDGTLYPVLHGLEKAGHIQSYWQNSETGRKRKYYHITDSGKTALDDKMADWRFFIDSMSKVLEGEVNANEE